VKKIFGEILFVVFVSYGYVETLQKSVTFSKQRPFTLVLNQILQSFAILT